MKNSSFKICSSSKCSSFKIGFAFHNSWRIYWHDRQKHFLILEIDTNIPLQRVLQSKSWENFIFSPPQSKALRGKEIFLILDKLSEKSRKRFIVWNIYVLFREILIRDNKVESMVMVPASHKLQRDIIWTRSDGKQVVEAENSNANTLTFGKVSTEKTCA